MVDKIEKHKTPHVFKHHVINRIIALILLLWSTDLGDELLAPAERAFKPKEAQTTVERRPLAGDKYRKQNLKSYDLNEVDARRFQLAFMRQAQESLLPCLKSEIRINGSLALSSRLDKSGRLHDIKTIGQALPDCARTAISEMNFADLTSAWQQPSMVIQWRVDW